jgi:hypothetical protein
MISSRIGTLMRVEGLASLNIIVYNCDSNRSSYVKITAEGSFLHKGSSAKDQTALAGRGL